MALNPIIPQLKTWVGRQSRLSLEPGSPVVDTDRITQVVRVLRALEHPALPWGPGSVLEVLDYLARVTYRSEGPQGAYTSGGEPQPGTGQGVDYTQFVRSVNGILPDPTTGNVTVTFSGGEFSGILRGGDADPMNFPAPIRYTLV